MYNARAVYTDIEHAVRLADTVEGACHERIVLYRVGKYNQLAGADALAVSGQFSGLTDDLTHHADCIQVCACLGRSDVDRGAHQICGCQRFRNRANQNFIALGKALLYKRGESADKVDTAGSRCAIQRLCERHIRSRVGCRADHCHRCDGNALVDDRDTQFCLDLLAGFHQMLRFAGDFVINLVAGGVDVAGDAVEQRNAHRDGTNIQMFILDHFDGF